MNFDSENGLKNDLKDNNEKSCSWFRSIVSHKIDFKAVFPRIGHVDSLGVNFNNPYFSKCFKILNYQIDRLAKALFLRNIN